MPKDATELYYMTVERLLDRLAGLHPKTKVRFHTSGAEDMSILSVYTEPGVERPAFVEIDIGEAGPNQTGNPEFGHKPGDPNVLR